MSCLVVDCERPVSCKKRGLCHAHNLRFMRHGDVRADVPIAEKHGRTHDPLYATWVNMRRRCTDPGMTGYSDYGGRGVSVCKQWMSSFTRFANEVGPRPGKGYSLDRIDNNGNYEPGNVRWACQSDQNKNQRTRRDNTSGHKGVCYSAERGGNKWRAYTGGTKSRRELGYFATFEEAVAARHDATVHDLQYQACCDLMVEIRSSVLAEAS